jgi:hypothetical protein
MTKSEILIKIDEPDGNLIFDSADGFIFNYNGPIQPIYRAMDEYAKQQAVAFAIHYAEAHVNWLINQRKYPDPSIIATDRMDVRYDHFIENQFIEQQNKP